jgi:putative transposase
MKNDNDWSLIPEKQQELFQKRLALVESLLDDSITETDRKQIRQKYCLEENVSGRTVRNYLRWYKNFGQDGLIFYHPKEPSPRITHPGLREKVLELIRERPTRTVPQIRRLLSTSAEYQDKISQVSDRTIYRFLIEQGLSQEKRYLMASGQDKNVYRQFQAEYSLALVQADARDGIWIKDAFGKDKKTYLFAWVDDYSRKILFARYYFDEKLPRMEDSFKNMILRWGVPEKTYLDNGSVYIAAQFAWILKELGIKKVHHPPYQAWCKGKVEAIMKTIKLDFQADAQLAGFSTLDELNSALWAWMDVVYDRRIHSTTGEAPHKRYLEGLKNDHRRITDLSWFNNLFLLRENRTVTKYGVIKLFGNTYLVNKVSAGTTVEVRFDPFDLSSIYRFEKGSAVETLQAAKMNQKEVNDLPEEKQKQKREISHDAAVHFAELREQHKKLNPQGIAYSKLKETKT